MLLLALQATPALPQTLSLDLGQGGASPNGRCSCAVSRYCRWRRRCLIMPRSPGSSWGCRAALGAGHADRAARRGDHRAVAVPDRSSWRRRWVEAYTGAVQPLVAGESGGRWPITAASYPSRPSPSAEACPRRRMLASSVDTIAGPRPQRAAAGVAASRCWCRPCSSELRRAFVAFRKPSRDPASLPFPYLRRAPRERHRQHRAPFRLVPPHPRPWRRALHRPARPLWHDAGGSGSGFAGLRRCRNAPFGMGRAHRRQGEGAPRGHREPQPADRRRRGLRDGHRGSGSLGRVAAARVR
ncbi:hypothetical protein BTHI11S_04740 [Bosea thiooxidans]